MEVVFVLRNLCGKMLFFARNKDDFKIQRSRCTVIQLTFCCDYNQKYILLRIFFYYRDKEIVDFPRYKKFCNGVEPVDTKYK